MGGKDPSNRVLGPKKQKMYYLGTKTLLFGSLKEGSVDLSIQGEQPVSLDEASYKGVAAKQKKTWHWPVSRIQLGGASGCCVGVSRN